VRDGEEILIGGLIRDEEGKENNKIPLLGNIPILKSLFSFKGKSGSSQELIILITPHIIAQSIESSAPTSLVPETGIDPMASAAPVSNASSQQPTGTIDDSFDNAFDTSF
jgi:type II secretory pathway component GspD/PulD (secretin)